MALVQGLLAGRVAERAEGQGRHWDSPVAFASVPGAHSTQRSAPLALTADPSAQGEHTIAPSCEYVPGGHVSQVEDAFAPVAALRVPAGQEVHTLGSTAPTALLHVP